MFISIIGTRASGKSSVQQYLLSRHGFQHVRLVNEKSTLDYPWPGKDASRTMNSNSHSSEEREPHVSNDISPSPNSSTPLYFNTASDLLDHVTRNWRDSFVSCDLDTPELIEQFIKRPFFLLVAVDAPLLTRYTRLISHAPNLSLEAFMEDHDTLMYGRQNADRKFNAEVGELAQCLSLHDMFRLQANVHIFNPFSSFADLYIYLDAVNLPDPDRLRPLWDTYFMTLAALASQRSNCMKRRVGAILVRDKRIVSTGYNGTPRNVRNCSEGGCRRCNSGGPSGEALDECLCLHAEENALLEAGRERVGAGAVLYCNTCPCLGCAIKIVQTGVKEVVYNLSYKVDDRTAALFKEAGVVLRQHSPPQ